MKISAFKLSNYERSNFSAIQVIQDLREMDKAQIEMPRIREIGQSNGSILTNSRKITGNAEARSNPCITTRYIADGFKY